MKEIPGFNRYYFNDKHELISKIYNRKVKGHRTPHGYIRVAVINDEGNITSKGLHWLIALAYHGVPNAGYVPNHKNGIRDDNRPENLEWVTFSQNRKDAFERGYAISNQPVMVKDNINNKILYFHSIGECARYYNLHKTNIKTRCHRGEHRVWPGDLQFRSPPSKDPWPEVDIEQGLLEYGIEKPILVKDLYTNEIIEFKSGTKAMEFLDIKSLSVFSNAFKGNTQPVIKERYQLKYKADKEDWKKPVFSKATVLIQVTDTKTGEITTYATARDAAKALGILPTTLNERLKVNQGGERIFPDGKKYKRIEKTLDRVLSKQQC